MREIEHSLRVLRWLQTEDGAKGRNFPDPLPLPGDKRNADRDQVGGGEGFTSLDDMDEFFRDDPWFANVLASRN